jgi:hypothetical protein
MVRANRGAARVSLMWTVMMAVITLTAVAFGYFAHDDRSKALDESAAARVEASTADERLAVANQKVSELSNKLGFYDRNSTVKDANTSSAGDAISRVRDSFPDIPSSATDFEKIMPFIEAEIAAARQRISTLETQVGGLESELSTAKAARIRDNAAKDQELAAKNDELASERANAADREENLNQRLADSESENDQIDRRSRETEADYEDQVRELNSMIAMLEQNLATARAKNDIRIQRARTEEADGKVLSVSSTLPLAWIDIGSDDRLATGMGFEIRASRMSGVVVKARGIVRRVERNRAEIEVFDVADPYDPVVSGDFLFSPIYDPVGERTAVLAGRFSGAWDEQRLTMILGEMGIRVQDTLTGTTDMLITGGEVYYDELGEALEDPIDPSQLPVYTEAVNAGIPVVPISTLRDYLPAQP